MEFRQLEAFVNAVKYKSFSKAADLTFLSQPTISAHISNLERELGLTLLNRMGREITLTKQGQEFYPYAVNILSSRQKALDFVHGGDKEPEGVLELQASTIPGQYFLPELMAEFIRLHSGVRFNVEQSDSKKVIENIRNHRGEIGFTGCHANGGLHYEPVFTDDLVIITPAYERFAAYEDGSVLSLELFKKEAFILREEGSGTRRNLEKGDKDAFFREVSATARMNNMEAIRQAVSYGLGVSVVSGMAVASGMTPSSGQGGYGLRYFRLAEFEERRSFYMVNDKNICLSPLGELFYQYVLQYVKERELYR